jgi:hypothetical protein
VKQCEFFSYTEFIRIPFLITEWSFAHLLFVIIETKGVGHEAKALSDRNSLKETKFMIAVKNSGVGALVATLRCC